MEFSFENKCTVDQQMMTESVRSNRKIFVTLSRIPVAITGLGIVSILARAAIQAYLDLPMLLRWTIFFLLFLRIATTPRRTARRVIKNFKSMYKVDSVEATTQFGDKILYTLHGAETCTYSYDAIRKVISLGGDADTMAAITGGIAWTYYRVENGGALTQDMAELRRLANDFMPEDFICTAAQVEQCYAQTL